MPTLRSFRLVHPLLRTSSVISFRRSGNTKALPAIVTPLNLRVRLVSTSGYGDQGGDPISDNPQKQGPRPRIDTEHPGPEPVAEGRGKSGHQPEETRGTTEPEETANKKGSGNDASKPKIHNEPQPVGKGAQAHNKNLRERGHSEVARDDHAAGKGYWGGHKE